jgi:hypothetical protein
MTSASDEILGRVDRVGEEAFQAAPGEVLDAYRRRPRRGKGNP